MAITSSCREAPVVELPPARREARRLYLEGLDQVMRLNDGVAFDRLRDALMTDAGYLPALGDLWLDVAHSHRVAAIVDTAVTRVTDPGVSRCLLRAAAAYRGVTAALPPAPRHESADARRCSFYVRYFLEQPHRRLNLDSLRTLVELYPESPALANAYYADTAVALDITAMRDAVRAAEGHDRSLVRASLLAGLSHSLHETGDDSAAIELERSVTRDPAWKLPGFRIAWAGRMSNHGSLRALNGPGDHLPLIRHVDSIMSVISEIRHSSLRSGDPTARLSVKVVMGVEAIDRGRLGDAVQLLSAAVPLVDSIGDLGWRTYVYMRYGRALVKAGRAPDAERFLLAARSLGDSAAVPRVQKEVEHNLLHLYESLGQDSAAFRAGEGFVRFASQAGIDGVRMMSARDVGMFLRARGRVDESRQFFERMLADIDSLGYGANFAGEYYELTGAVDKSLAAYTQAAGSTEEPVRALAGLVRLALAMGDTAAARRWAIVHDARRDSPGRPEAAPLLPAVLRKTVGGAPARQAFENARREVAKHDQVSAWASLTSDLAELEGDAGRFSLSASLADSAVAAATSVGAAAIALRARALGAYARARNTAAGDAISALGALYAIAREADGSGGVMTRSEIRRMIAGALASQGRWLDALAEFKRAVIPLDSVAGRIAMDPGQASFRSAQRRAYDDALATIVRNAKSPDAIDAYVAWSARRKGRAYAVQFPVERDARIPRPAHGTALVDFVFLDTMLAALVVTAREATIVPLDVRPKQVRADAEALRRAVDLRVGSSLDVGRARFPLAVAHRLYQNLLGPLEPHLAGARTLVIIPDGILSLVPFDALVTSMPGDSPNFVSARYVLDDRAVLNATTMRAELPAWRVRIRRLTMIDPGTAPDATREVDAVVSALSPGIVTALRGEQATRTRAIAAMQAADIVHFVAHAEANEHDPGSSQIELAREGGDDGRLGAAEVAALRLDAPLIFLSACETANGRVLDGEGVLSMSRSFLRAGARATLATLWPVGPSAADFAEAFYANLVRSGDGAEALRSAKLLLRQRGVPPTTWAAYQMFAAPAPRDPTPAIVANRD